MTSARRFAFTPNLVVGISIMLLGIALVLDRLNVVDLRELARWWPLLVILFGASLVAQAWRTDPAGGDTGQPERPIVSPGFVLFLLVAYLFVSYAQHRQALTHVEAEADTVSVFVVMAAEGYTNRATPFRRGEVTTVMGRARLDLREATVPPGGEAVVDVLTVMGKLELVVPEGWTVDIEAPRVMGRVRDERWRRTRTEAPPSPATPEAAEPVEAEAPAIPPPRVVVRGIVLLGGITIRS